MCAALRCACIMQAAMREHTGIPSQQHLAIASRDCAYQHTEPGALERLRGVAITLLQLPRAARTREYYEAWLLE